ncbi:hypothetical protein CAAN1_01S05160 [[Candida] anglica]|uniref:Acetyl-CoA transporter n=1 Tax=[Candida] anglica TaxID=148631 RepID=A0ABP0EJL5_9ASCO
MAGENHVYKRVHGTGDSSNIPENQFIPAHAAFDEENDGLLPVSMQDVSRNPTMKPSSSNSLPAKDRKAFIVLVILYLLQGVPVGLAFGSIPFLLKAKLSYSQVGIFSLAAYPYSLKLLWSPIVDAIYSPKVGRRRSWIIPIQTISGLTLLYLGSVIDSYVSDPAQNLTTITFCFFLLVFFCATQDIAVDGWALTCLSPEALSFASTAQTIGINAGYFSSFTIFLALSSPDFANKYIRSTPIDEGLFSLGSYLNFWGWMYLIVTGVLLLIPEDPPHLAKLNQAKLEDEKARVEKCYNNSSSNWSALKNVYFSMYQVLKLPNVQTFVVILLFAKLGFQANEAATNLKLLEKGLSKEDLSITVLIDFPFEMIFGYYAGRWSNGKSPLKPWLFGFAGRLVAAAFAQLIVLYFPSDGKLTSSYFLLIIVQHLLSSFMSTIQFVSLCAFHTKIADPAIGGTYMTTLNTLSNYGGTWPRLIIYYLIDKFTYNECIVNEKSVDIAAGVTVEGFKEQCKTLGGEVLTLRDGYYYTNFICVTLGVVILLWVKRKATYLQSLPSSAWRVVRED